MEKNSFFIKLIILLINLHLNCYLCIEHPPYQVSIWMRGKNNGNGTHLCNGAVIHERLVLTTADCVHYKVIGTNINNPIKSTMLVVVAGSLNSPAKKLITVNVSSVDVAKDFNSMSLENDICILKLNESLPLESRNDIKWIILDDFNDIKNNSCAINSQNPASPANIVQQTHPVQIFDNQNCTNTTNFSSPRNNDICSSYIFSSGNICNKTDDEIITSSDRGTALTCDSKLIGLLSYIIPHHNEKNDHLLCSDINKLNAIYTRVATYLNWIYEKISIESKIDMGKANYTMSPPYVASAPSPTISENPPGSNMPETEHEIKSTTQVPTTSVSPQSTTMKSASSSTTQNSNQKSDDKTVNKTTSNAPSVQLKCFNSMFAVTLILVLSCYHNIFS